MRQSEADQLVQMATAEIAHGRMERATGLLEQATRADPRHPMALTRQAEVALYRKDHHRALALADSALAIEPNFAPAWSQRSSACWFAARPADALQAARRAVDIQPPNPDFRLRLARLAAWSGLSAEARDVLVPLLAAAPHDRLNYAAAVSMLGELAIAEGRFDEAPVHLDHALDLRPDLDATRMLRGMNELRLGRFRSGWPDYAARESILELYPDGVPKLADRPWRGESLAGKTLVVLDDQGHGDAIQFFRYLPLLRDRGAARITWRTFPPLRRLLATAAPYATVLAALPEGPRFDFQCSSTCLPRWFDTELDSIPADVPYLPLPARRTAPTRRRRAPKVGLVWSGDTRHPRDRLRSIPAELFLQLADVPGIRFHSLQHEVRAADQPALEARPAIDRQVETATDFAETARLIAELDLVITVDTAIAHLAGALGKPVWVLLHVAPDWRWLTDRIDSPWYPTARLFRVAPAEWLEPAEPSPGADWRPLLRRVEAALRAFAAG